MLNIHNKNKNEKCSRVIYPIYGSFINNLNEHTSVLDDPKVLQLMSMLRDWPVGVIWLASYQVFLGTAYGTKSTYLSAITSLNTIFGLLAIGTTFKRHPHHPPTQVDIFMGVAFMASHRAASSCRGAKCAAEDAWLLLGNRGPVIDPALWKRMFRGIGERSPCFLDRSVSKLYMW